LVTATQIIYVELLDEGATVYRPFEATRDEDGAFRVPDRASEGESWRFDPGSRVVCELRAIGGAEPSLVAIWAAS
jgi:hypothetical protein